MGGGYNMKSGKKESDKKNIMKGEKGKGGELEKRGIKFRSFFALQICKCIFCISLNYQHLRSDAFFYP